MVTCRETVGDCGRSLSQTSYFSEDRRCSRLPTDTTVKRETERSDTASVSITKRAPLSFPSVRPTGPVVSVLDGDTIEILHNNHAERIHLNRIDCIEKGQAFGKRAKQAASDLVFGKEVTLQTFGKDKYGRTIGDVILPDGLNLNQELVKQGWCWWYRKYAPGNTVLEGLVKEAREAKKGLWADPQLVPLWEWRGTSKLNR
jgi:micrococcal nuclease